MVYKSLYKDFFYEDSGSTQLSYYLTCGNETIYAGKATNPKGIKLNIRKLVEDWVQNDMPDFRPFDGVLVLHEDACKVFRLYNEEGSLLEEYMVFLSYEPLAVPMFTYRGINGHADPRQKIFLSMLKEIQITGDTLTVENNQIRAIYIGRTQTMADAIASTTLHRLAHIDYQSGRYESGVTDNTYYGINGKIAESNWGPIGENATVHTDYSDETDYVIGFWKKYKNTVFYNYLKNGEAIWSVQGAVSPFWFYHATDYVIDFDKDVYGWFVGKSNAWAEYHRENDYGAILAIVLPKTLNRIDPDILKPAYTTSGELYYPGDSIGPSFPFVYFSGTVNMWRNVEGSNGFTGYARNRVVYCVDGVYEAE